MTSPSSALQTYNEFMAQALAREQRRDGLRPIAPSVISEISVSHKRVLRRHTKLFWTSVVTLELAFGSSVAALVFVIQDLKSYGLEAIHLIWLLLSVMGGISMVAMVAALHGRRGARVKAEQKWALLEIAKYKRDFKKIRAEAEQASMHGSRLRQSLRETSLRSRSVSTTRGRQTRRSGSIETRTGKPSLDEGRQHRKSVEPSDVGGKPKDVHSNDATQSRLTPEDMMNGQTRLSSANLSELNQRSSDVRYDTANIDQYVMAEIDRLKAEIERGNYSHVRPELRTLSTHSTGIRKIKTNSEDSSTSVMHAGKGKLGSEQSDENLNAFQSFTSVTRAGNGELGSDQSDENFRENNELDSDARSENSYMWHLRQTRSVERVSPWKDSQDAVFNIGDALEEAHDVRTGREDLSINDLRKEFLAWTDKQRRSRSVLVAYCERSL